jgi:hypothetical protein
MIASALERNPERGGVPWAWPCRGATILVMSRHDDILPNDPRTPRDGRRRPRRIFTGDGVSGEVHEHLREPEPRRRQRLPGGHAARGRHDLGLLQALREDRAAERSLGLGTVGLVWLDRHGARLLVRRDGSLQPPVSIEGVEGNDPRATGGRGTTPPAHLGGDPESHRHRNREEWLKRYYDEVIEHLEKLDRFVIAGPGPAKHELRRRLEHVHGMPDRVMGLLTVPERIGDPELIGHLDRLMTEV